MPNTSNYFISPLALSNLDGNIGVTFNGAAGEFSSDSIASAGDVNGDGFGDVLIDNYGGRGPTYLIFGHSSVWSSQLMFSSLNGVNGVVIRGGGSSASAGDVNGDGFDDVLIGTSGSSAYLIFGHAGTWDSSLVLASLNGANGIVINGIVTGSFGSFGGISVASAGDVNGDSINDMLIGVSAASPDSFSNAGSTYLIFGHTGVWSSPLSLGSLNGIDGLVINGIAANDRSGNSVASAGDVNGDGFDDLLIGAYYASPDNISRAGSVYLIFGHSNAWSSPLSLSSLSGNNGIVINGVSVNGYTGNSVASAGDVNGDGFDDLLISVSGSGIYGVVYLIFGHEGIWSSPLTLSSLNENNYKIVIGGNGLSSSSLASAGDVNGDGISDIIIGSTNVPTYLIFGHTGTWNLPLVPSSLNGSNGVVIRGITAVDATGCSLASAGDVNGDGLDDILIGAYRASPGGLAQAGSTYLIFGDNLELLTNILIINQGQTVFLNNNMLAAVHTRNFEINASIPFRISNVVHGTFSKLNFLQSELSQNLISFTHDGSIYPPSFEVTIGNWAMVGPIAATISFDVSPILYVNLFSVGQGQTTVLTNRTIRATDIDCPPDALIFRVSNVLHGNFVNTNTATIEYQFNQSVLNQRQIAFTADGSPNAPSYMISVSDGRITTPAIPGIVNFNAAPLLLNNQLTLVSGQQKAILSNNDLSASDTMMLLGELIFTPSTLNCHFENINLPGVELPLFLQKNIEANQILFIWDGYSQPAYNMSVSDGTLSSNGSASITIIPTSDVTVTTNVTNTEATNINAIIGGVVAVGTIGLLFFGLQWYLKKKTNNQFQKILSAGITDAGTAINPDVIRPIVNKIFGVINTTGFFGQRTEADTKAYMIAIGKIISELQRQKANLDFNAMTIIDKESFINEIANQTRQQSLSKHKEYSHRNCTRYFTAEVTPQEIEDAAEGIALASVAWQRRQMNDISAKSTSLGLELGKLSNIGFAERVANEDVPPEKQFKWMQNNHMQAVEQQRQQVQKERKRLEERLAQQERELAFFKWQDSMVLKS